MFDAGDWVHGYLWVAQPGPRPVDSEETHTTFWNWWHTPQWAAAQCPVLYFCLPRLLLNDPLSGLDLLHYLPAWEMEKLVSNCAGFSFSACTPPTAERLQALGIYCACHNSLCPGCRQGLAACSFFTLQTEQTDAVLKQHPQSLPLHES